jgi:hypothetical protein
MNDKQTETYASLAKSYDFMDDNSANTAITSIVQLVGLSTVLGNTLEQIIESDGIGKQNNKGITIDKCELISGNMSSKNLKKIRAFYQGMKGKIILETI